MQVQLNSTLNISNDNFYTMPQLVLRTAATPKNATEPLAVPWKFGNDTTQFYFYLHLAEMETLEANETREFDIFLNGEDWFKKSVIPNRTVNTISTIRPITCPNGECKLELIRTARSTRPPLLNAIEVYIMVEFPLPETERKEVEAVKKIKDVYDMNRVDWQGDPCNPPELSWDGLNCSYNDGTEPPRITSLNFSSSKLRGRISRSIQNLTQLQNLDLSNNSLSGEVPDFLADLKSLSVINLSANNLNGSIPQSLLDKEKEGLLKLVVEGNPSLHCSSRACKNQGVGKKRRVNRFVIVVVILAVVVIVLVLSVLVLCLKMNRKKRTSMSRRAQSTSNMKKGRQFTHLEVVTMTNNFGTLLGRGGFGSVYEGFLDSNTQVAVKVLSEPSEHGRKQFRAEVKTLMRVHHKNLVTLVGYCDERDHLALIYEYMAKGDLHEHLSGSRASGLLSWGSRLKILAEAAYGLEYLHNGCKPPIIHRDVKTSNILLDSTCQAKIADFGMSRGVLMENEARSSLTPVGTIGYIDPEYYTTIHFTELSDVYSFGVVILEMLTNRPVGDIVNWVRLRQGSITQIVDQRLQDVTIDMVSLEKAVKLGLVCASIPSSARPSMTYVVQVLNELLAAENARTSHGNQNAGSRMEIEMRTPVRANTF